MEDLTGENSTIDVSDVVKKATPKQIADIFNQSVAMHSVSSHAFRDVAINGIPKMNPLSAEYINWWKYQRNCCINGVWIGGRWMPGRLYFHANFFNIERTFAKNRSRKQLGLPDIRDIDWEVFTLVEIAKGLSGFDSFGNPIYDNDAQGFLMIGPRDFGKSVIGASNIAYEYTFFRNNHVLVSGFETKYTNPLLSKVRIGLDNMPGGLDFLDTYYPPPFSHQRLKNDWTSEVMSGRKVRRDGNEVTTGYQSAIFHRVFADNIMAANGLRVGFHVFEEVGAFDNLINSYNASVPCWRSGPHQFGVPYLVGTGGEMEKGTTNAQRMFYEPDTFNLLKFHNDYDKDGSQIAFFIPADRTQFFNDEGVCTPDLRAKGRKFLLDRRAKKKATDRSTYDNELMYYPLKPQEAFLSTNGNIFPRHLLEDQLTYLLSTKANTLLGTKGKLTDTPDGGVSFTPSEDMFEVDFPHTPGQKDEGAIVIYERPHKDENGQIPFGLYLGGIDPIDQDEAEGSLSLGSIFIYKRFVSADKTYDMVVAEYTGRFDKSEQFYDICRKLLIFYNAKGLYENMIKGLKQYFEMKNCLYLLKEQPNSLIKDIVPSSKVERGYGIHMTKEIKNYIIRLIADHLNTQYEPGKYNTNKLYQINLLKELIAYNDKGNFDRVIAFGLCLLHKEAMFKHKVEVEAEVTDVRKNYFNEYFKDHGF